MGFKEQNQSTLFQELSELVARLRLECPWDREQTQETLKPCLLEEAFEVAEAVESGNPEKLKEELGDLLMVILLYCEISTQFKTNEVLSDVIDKMKTRHPHVFGDEKITSSQAVLERWEEIKKKTAKGETGLKRATVLNDRAIQVGFNPSSLEEMTGKLEEEAEELTRANSPQEREEESGDLLFTAVNICRMLDVEPESALLQACTKFEQRMEKVFKELKNRGMDPKKTSFQKMDEVWDEIK